MLRYLTAGESHGKALVAILEGCPANLPLSENDINPDLARRQEGLGRGARMKIEKDKAEILSGVRSGKTIGSPIAISLPNQSREFFDNAFTKLRPGHADLAGAEKYHQEDLRNILERASARETAMRVAVGAVAKKLLSVLKITISSRVVRLGGTENEKEWNNLVEKASADGDSLGGDFEVVIKGAPVGLGSYVHWDRRLDGNLARAIMAIPAVKGVEIGKGFGAAELTGSKLQDEIFYDKKRGFYHKTNNAGGLEGGVTNGEDIIIRAAIKPIATLKKPLQSVDFVSKKPAEAFVERADVCAVFPAAVIGEAVAALEIADACLEKFGGDCVEDLTANLKTYLARLS